MIVYKIQGKKYSLDNCFWAKSGKHPSPFLVAYHIYMCIYIYIYIISLQKRKNKEKNGKPREGGENRERENSHERFDIGLEE